MKRAVVICSGGLDSVTLAYYMKSKIYELTLVSFDYGQRHSKELDCALQAASDLQVEHILIDLQTVGAALKGSALTDFNTDVPEGHYSADNMAVTVVPNRNAIMLSVAWGIAVSNSADVLAYGAHAGDLAQYADCRPEFVNALENALQIGTDQKPPDGLHMFTPFLLKTKADIVKIGHDLNVPFEKTWSCYKGGEIACGICGTCCERCESFAINGLEDPLPYLDKETWKKFVTDFKKATFSNLGISSFDSGE